jgi:hypothetical protein
MKTVWKFPLVIDDVQYVQMPANAHILTVQMQESTPCLWALVNPAMPVESRKILIAGTGHPREDLNDLVNYIGTFQDYGGSLIFHVFEQVDFAKLAGSAEVAEAVRS